MVAKKSKLFLEIRRWSVVTAVFLRNCSYHETQEQVDLLLDQKKHLAASRIWSRSCLRFENQCEVINLGRLWLKLVVLEIMSAPNTFRPSLKILSRHVNFFLCIPSRGVWTAPWEKKTLHECNSVGAEFSGTGRPRVCDE